MALIEYFGTECPHCRTMAALVDKLEQETGLKVERRETWHDKENEAKRAMDDGGFCGGVPFFVNTGNGRKLCGAVPYETLKTWATEE